MRKLCFSLFILFLSIQVIFADDNLIISTNDIRLTYDSGTGFGNASGYHLYVRKKTGIESILLTETTKDPQGKSDNYAYRALEYNKVNGDEVRYLNGQPLTSKYAKYSLIDSSPEPDKEFGESFHIYIPSKITYGYPWTRNEIVSIGKGTFINIRAFSKKYADYSGRFVDNPFMFDLGTTPSVTENEKVPKEVPVLTDNYNPDAVDSFKLIAAFGGGKMIYSKGPDTLCDDIKTSLDEINPKECVDVVFAIDTTGSMKDDVAQLRKQWIPSLVETLKNFGDIRLGLLLYRDYGDSYNYKGLPVKLFDFTSDCNQFVKNLNSFVIYGTEGGDIPEAVYEALYGSVSFYQWRSEAQKKIILIGDAEAHPTPRGSKKYTKDLVSDEAEKNDIKIDTIILPDDKSVRGR